MDCAISLGVLSPTHRVTLHEENTALCKYVEKKKGKREKNKKRE
jgi:hypothetical protein